MTNQLNGKSLDSDGLIELDEVDLAQIAGGSLMNVLDGAIKDAVRGIGGTLSC